MLDLFIYYRVRDEHAQELAQRVQAMQAELEREHGLAGQLKRRPEASEGLQTWMEIYLATDSRFTAALGAAVQAGRLSELIDGNRHTELFMDVSPCA
jgi:hypothetical protein